MNRLWNGLWCWLGIHDLEMSRVRVGYLMNEDGSRGQALVQEHWTCKRCDRLTKGSA